MDRPTAAARHRPCVVLCDNRDESECALQKSTTAKLHRHLQEACRRYGGRLVTVKSLDDVAATLALPVCCIVLGGSSLSLSTKLQMRTIAHATAMVTRFPHVPCLGVCFGMQVLASLYGGRVAEMPEPSRGWLPVTALDGPTETRYCNHGDAVTHLPPEFRATHHDANGVVMGMVSPPWGRHIRGLQFHPEADDAVEVDRFVRAHLVHSRL